MKHASFADMRCSIARALEMIGPWWTFMILRDAFMGIRRFKDFERSLGIAKNTLTTRLRHLVDNGLLDKVPGADGSKYSEYQLTEKGRELFPILLAMSQWGDKWAGHEDGPLFTIIDRRDGLPLPPQVIRDRAGSPIPAAAIGLAGPADAAVQTDDQG